MKPIFLASTGDVQQHITDYQAKVDMFRELIKELTGKTPDNFVFTFSIKGSTVFSLEIGENEADVTMSYFVYMYQYYGRILDKLKAMLPQQ